MAAQSAKTIAAIFTRMAERVEDLQPYNVEYEKQEIINLLNGWADIIRRDGVV